jgi:hypothetical protein
LAQLLGSSQRPWIKTTGVAPEAFAASISRLSRSEIDAMPNPLQVAADDHPTQRPDDQLILRSPRRSGDAQRFRSCPTHSHQQNAVLPAGSISQPT